MEEASPVKWHLAHTSWFFETLVLEPAMPGYRPFHPQYRFLFNSYYNSVGPQYPRQRRGLLTRPSLKEVLAYRQHVDHHVAALLAKGPDVDPQTLASIELGLHHEQQHQELVLTDVKHALSHNPLSPAYCDPPTATAATPDPHAWHAYPEGLRRIGHEGPGFAFDCERPRHRVFVEAFELGSRPVTNAEYLAFVEDDGYERPELWLSDGWMTRQAQAWGAPLYWERRDGNRFVFTLAGLQPLRLEEPVCHVSYYEADAYARWSGARLPTEAEWECAAEAAVIEGNLVESGRFHPAPVEPSAAGPAQLFGDVWEWTRGPFAPYPGYQPLPGPASEYNGKFMCNQITLRGGSCATPRSHIRPTYRNFFFPDARWQFSGIRLARDAG
jgi:ergothioneine biosynthesis protein EgtB